MPSLNIRNMSDTLMKRLKVGSAEAGVTLREYVIGKLEGGNGEDRSSGTVESKRGTKVSAAGEREAGITRRSAEPAPVERKGVGVRLDAVAEVGRGVGKVSVETPAPKKLVQTCPHGKEKGWNCGLCGGQAKVGE